MPRLSDDVVIVGRTEQTEQKRTERGLPAAIDVVINLGNGIVLKGRGLDALLGGQIRLASVPGEPLRAGGTLHIVKGTYSAYGRELAIEHGLLRFNGPIDNPSLDILAMRRGQEVEAGVAVRGTVLSPRVTLVSEPPVSEAEKLSWLVLGHGLETAGQGDLSKLQSSAGALLSQGAAAGVQSQIARAFGLDQFSVGSATQDGLEQRIVTLGKQISSRLYVSVEQGLQSASSVLHMRYALSSKLTLEAEAGTRSALSLFYNITFD
jgi:translocation and assembly module TamB